MPGVARDQFDGYQRERGDDGGPERDSHAFGGKRDVRMAAQPMVVGVATVIMSVAGSIMGMFVHQCDFNRDLGARTVRIRQGLSRKHARATGGAGETKRDPLLRSGRRAPGAARLRFLRETGGRGGSETGPYSTVAFLVSCVYTLVLPQTIAVCTGMNACHETQLTYVAAPAYHHFRVLTFNSQRERGRDAALFARQ